jgi:beta-xylosidase
MVSTFRSSTRSATTSPVRGATYTNPIDIDVADPFVLTHDGTYYLYGTSARDGYKVWSSKDLVHWTAHGYCFRRNANTWGRDLFWAPSALYRDGKFYLYYSCRGRVAPGQNSHRICVAVADSPLGPFKEARTPLFDIGQATIDAHPFVDDDGKGYIYYSLDHAENRTADGKNISELYVLPLAPDLLSVPEAAKPTFCSRPDTAWEGSEWNEAPYVFKYDDTYVLMYSARGFFDPRYSVGYATARSPLGPWTKAPENPVLRRTDDVSGTGHNCVARSPDGTEWFCVYHVHKNITGGNDRRLAVDRMKITKNADGSIKLRVQGPTHTPQPLPSGSPRVPSRPVHTPAETVGAP